MELDIFTIVAATTAIVVSVLASLTGLLLRRPCKSEDEHSHADADTPLSIVIACHDNATELERNLPPLLEQHYDNYEVIVVDESSTDNTDDVLKQLKAKHPNLYTTFIPESSHYLSRRKLALTVGVKAAKNEWIVFVDVASKPADSHWLARLASKCAHDKDILMGYANYDDTTRAYYRYRQMLNSVRNLRMAQCSVAYASGGNTIAIRRSLFMEGNGFLKNLTYLRGEYDFMVNDYATPSRVAIAPHATTIKDKPTRRSWLNDNLYYLETRRHLERSKKWRLTFNLDALFLHAALWTDGAIIAVTALTAMWIALAASIFALALMFTLRTLSIVRIAKFMGDKLPIWLVPFMELRMVWTNAMLLLRYKASDKYDFIRK